MFSYEENEKVVNKAIMKCLNERFEFGGFDEPESFSGNTTGGMLIKQGYENSKKNIPDMKEELTIKFMGELIKLKNKFDSEERKLTIKITASNELIVRVYPYFDAPIAIVRLNYITEGQCESVIQKVKELV